MIFFILFLFLSLSLTEAEAVTRYVSTTGTTTNCTTMQNINTPASSITAGLACTGSGDSLLIRGGVYVGDLIITDGTAPNIAGKAENSRTWIGAYCPSNVCENVIIRGQASDVTVNIWSDSNTMRYVTFDNLKIDGNFIPDNAVLKVLSGLQFMRFQNMEVYNSRCGSGIETTQSVSNTEYINVKSHDHGIITCPGSAVPHGFYTHGGPAVFDNVEAYNNLQMGMQIYDFNNTPTSVTVKNSYFHNNSRAGNGAGLLVQGNNHTIYNNIFANDPRTGLTINYNGGSNQLIYNNTMYGNKGAGLEIGPGGKAVFNNIVYNNGQQITFYSGGETTGSHGTNLCGTAGTWCDVIGNPQFVDAAAGNFRLLSGSAAINVGTDLGPSYNVDIVGTLRPAGSWDIGAYEFIGVTIPGGGRYGSAVALDGSAGTGVDVPNSTSLATPSGITVQIDVLPTTTAEDRFRSAVGKVDSWYMFSSSEAYWCGAGNPGFYFWGAPQVCGTSNLPPNQWSNLAATYDQATGILSLYVNGTLTATRTGLTAAIPVTTGLLKIGNSQYTEPFEGRVDQLRIYNYALTQAQIQSNITSPIGVGQATVAVTGPSTTGNFITSASTQTIQGTAACSGAIQSLTWLSDRGPSGTLPASSPWTITNAPLTVNRVNTFTIGLTCTDGSSASTTINVRANGANRQIFALAFDETLGTTAADSSGNGYNASFTGTGNTWIQGRFGNAVSLTGAGALTIPTNDLLDVSIFTFSASVRPKTLPSTFTSVFSRGGSNPGGYYYLFATVESYLCNTIAGSPGGGFYQPSGGHVASCNTALLPPNVWSHVTVTYDGANVRFYLNGAQVGQPYPTTELIRETVSPLYIGTSFFNEFCNCDLDEARGYNYALPVGSFNPATDSCQAAAASPTVTSDYYCRIALAPTPAVWKVYPDAASKWYPDTSLRLRP